MAKKDTIRDKGMPIHMPAHWGGINKGGQTKTEILDLVGLGGPGRSENKWGAKPPPFKMVIRSPWPAQTRINDFPS